MSYKVIQWSTGVMGKHSLRYIIDNPNMELVGVKCYGSDKEGMDAGDIVGRPATGIKATQNIDAILALDADCVVLSSNDRSLAEPTIPGTVSYENFQHALRILESGKNVVSPHCPPTHYGHFSDPDAFLSQVNAACSKGNSSIIYAGIDPGFFTDQMSMILASACGLVRKINSWEILDYSTVPVPNGLGNLGFGKKPADLDLNSKRATLTMLWGGVMHLNAEALGIPLHDIEMDFDYWLSPDDFVSIGGVEVPQGTIRAYRFEMRAMSGGRAFYSLHHVTRLGKDAAPDWPRLGDEGGYRIEVDATLPISVDIPLGAAGGTGNGCDDTYIITAALLVNRIPGIVAAAPGYRTYLDLKPLVPSGFASPG